MRSVGVIAAAMLLLFGFAVSGGVAAEIELTEEGSYNTIGVPYESGGTTYDSVIINLQGGDTNTYDITGTAYINIDGNLGIAAGTLLTHGDTPHIAIAHETGSTGSVSVSGAASVLDAGYIYVGENSEGSLSVDNGGTVLSRASLLVGHFADGNGQVTVTGAGSSLTADNLWIGMLGEGKVDVLDGGTMTLRESVRFADGAGGGGSGELNVSGQNSLVCIQGPLTADGSGNATISVTDGGELRHSGTMVLRMDGRTDVRVAGAGSLINVMDPGNLAYGTGTIYLGSNAMLTVADGGKVKADALSMLSDQACLNIELSALCVADDYVAVDIENTLKVNGTLRLLLSGAYIPGDETTFNLFDWGSISYDYADEFIVDASAITGLGLSVDLSNLYVDGTVTIYGGPSAVPEPGSVALLCLGLVALFFVSRKSARRNAV